VIVLMFMHPVVTIFMAVWLGFVGFAGWQIAWRGTGATILIPIGMFLFGLALSGGGFFFEALKARRILETCLQQVKQAPNHSTEPASPMRAG
jgi:TRAP-type C4-dicarboxylate transport system permease small subunit